MAEKRMVVVTTDKDKRGVFFGQLIKNDTKGQVTLKDAQMAVYWSSQTLGVLGLASIGPQEGSKITPVVPQIDLFGVTSIMDATQKAVKEWRKERWS